MLQFYFIFCFLCLCVFVFCVFKFVFKEMITKLLLTYLLTIELNDHINMIVSNFTYQYGFTGRFHMFFAESTKDIAYLFNVGCIIIIFHIVLVHIRNLGGGDLVKHIRNSCLLYKLHAKTNQFFIF